MFIAASDTSTVTVQWAMAELLRHPEKMKKVNAELAEKLGSKDFVTESDLSELPYLHAVVKETLRLHPAVPLIPREVVADDMSLGGFHVPKGTGIIVNQWAIGRDKSAWPRPEEFIPERFLAGQEVHSLMVKEAYIGRLVLGAGCALEWSTPRGLCHCYWHRFYIEMSGDYLMVMGSDRREWTSMTAMAPC